MVFTNVTMQSEKYVCVRETGTTNNVVIIEMANPTAPVRRPITADSTILAPSSKTLALKASAEGGDNLQVFNLDTKQKLKAHLNTEKVTYWAWLNDTTIGMVTDKAVYHWDVQVWAAQPAAVAMCRRRFLCASPAASAPALPHVVPCVSMAVTIVVESELRRVCTGRAHCDVVCRTRTRRRPSTLTARTTWPTPRLSATVPLRMASGARSSASPPAPAKSASPLPLCCNCSLLVLHRQVSGWCTVRTLRPQGVHAAALTHHQRLCRPNCE